MSDFGIVLIIKKNTGPFTEGEKANISRLLTDIAASGDHEDISENFSKLEERDGNSLYTRFTEYYHDDAADEIREFAEEDDLPEAEEIAEQLQEKLGNGFSVSASMEDW